MNLYQTIKYPDGRIKEGVFPTLNWFEKIKSHIDFTGKNVVDIGCAEGMYSVLALNNGANRVVSVDNNPEKIAFCEDLIIQNGLVPEVYCAKFEDVAFNMDYDIIFCNMILHWLEEGHEEFRRIADAAKKYIVVIYRTRNPHYEQGGWFPTEEELERLAKSLGFEVKHKELLTTQDNNKEIFLTIFEKYKESFPVIEFVKKKHKYYDREWVRKMGKINKYLYNSTLIRFEEGLAIKTYIDGRDLWGDKPFYPRHGKKRMVFLNKKEKESVEKILSSIVSAGKKTGYYLQDANNRNIILKDEEAYIVDFEIIGLEPKNYVELN